MQDTAGSERYESMSRIYYRGARAAIVCYGEWGAVGSGVGGAVGSGVGCVQWGGAGGVLW